MIKNKNINNSILVLFKLLKKYFFIKKNTPYENGLFKLGMKLPDDYPMAPPKVIFITKIYHKDVD